MALTKIKLKMSIIICEKSYIFLNIISAKFSFPLVESELDKKAMSSTR